ncbi:MAG TPA: hypothetical protein VNH14_07735 [Gemmatimonadales bacterium]|nr:hypothetical protein [Gemmatimonadales bacterium]
MLTLRARLTELRGEIKTELAGSPGHRPGGNGEDLSKARLKPRLGIVC